MLEWFKKTFLRPADKQELARTLVESSYIYLRDEVLGRGALRPGATQHELLLLAVERRSFWRRTGTNRFSVSYLGYSREVFVPPSSGLAQNVRSLILAELDVVLLRGFPDSSEELESVAEARLFELFNADGVTADRS